MTEQEHCHALCDCRFFFPKLYHDVMKGTRAVYFPHLRLFSEQRNITLGVGTFRPISQANGDILLPVSSRLHRKHMELKIILHNPNGWNNESNKGNHKEECSLRKYGQK
jgi:hypothetical protein